MAMGHRTHPLVWSNLRNSVTSDDCLIVFIRCSFIAMHRTRACRPSDHFRLFHSVRHTVCHTKSVALHSPLEKMASSIVKERVKTDENADLWMEKWMHTHTQARTQNSKPMCACKTYPMWMKLMHLALATIFWQVFSVHGNREPFDD